MKLSLHSLCFVLFCFPPLLLKYILSLISMQGIKLRALHTAGSTHHLAILPALSYSPCSVTLSIKYTISSYERLYAIVRLRFK